MNEARTQAGLIVPADLVGAASEHNAMELNAALEQVFEEVLNLGKKGFCLIEGRVPEQFNGAIVLPVEMARALEAYAKRKETTEISKVEVKP